VLTAEEARVLDGLMVGSPPGAAVASGGGLRRARARGSGLEFFEYRHYEPGDDPRSIDWTVEARLEQLVVRVSRAEGDLRLHVLLDISRSMTVGTPPKLACAAKIAAALSYVAIERRDAAGLATFDHRIHGILPPRPGRSQLFRVLDSLGTISAAGSSSIDEALLRYGAAARGPGLATVVSDFFQPGAGLQGLRFLLHRGLSVAVVQVVAREELEPDFAETVEVVDVEHPANHLAVNATAIASYRRRLADHLDQLHGFCRARRLPYLRIDSATSFKGLVTGLEGSGVLAPVV
jgi:uncharacterized protein (DUF58 family)